MPSRGYWELMKQVPRQLVSSLSQTRVTVNVDVREGRPGGHLVLGTNPRENLRKQQCRATPVPPVVSRHSAYRFQHLAPTQHVLLRLMRLIACIIRAVLAAALVLVFIMSQKETLQIPI